MNSEIARCIAEQRAAADYIAAGGNDTAGAWMAVCDWTMEEAVIRSGRASGEYEAFLASKRILADPCGFDVPRERINPMLFEFQADIVQWALRRGKAAIFAHTGLGKGPMQMEWCKHVSEETGQPTLIAAPLAVSQQFMREAAKFGYDLTHARSQSDVRAGLNVTNYERLDLFDLTQFAGVSLDESSCIKDWTSKTAKTLIERLANTPFKLCSSATPSPNDHAELGTHAELLDVMRRSAMLAMFFEHDGGETSKWALKGHGKRPFWKFVASWAVCVKKPSDLGYEDGGFDLPPLNLQEHIVSVDHSVNTDGMLFRCPDLSATGLHKEMRLTTNDRARKVAELVADKKDVPWLLWCNTNYEAEALRAAIPDAVEVTGSDPDEWKEFAVEWFAGVSCMCRTRFRSKLPSWGSRAKSTGGSITQQIDKRSLTAQSPTSSNMPMSESLTSLSTTPLIESVCQSKSASTAKTRRTKETVSAGGNTRPTQTCATSPERPQRSGSATTPRSGSLRGSNHSASLQNNTALCLSGNAVVAPSAESTSQIRCGNDSTLTTAMKPELLGDCCVPTATQDSENSQIPRNYWSEQHCICGHLSGRRILISKPSIFGYGLNLQQCRDMAFVGLSYSFENLFQAIRRCWRFGQTKPVNAHIVIAETEGAVLDNIRRKERQYEELQAEMNQAMREEQLAARHKATRYDHEMEMRIPAWLR